MIKFEHLLFIAAIGLAICGAWYSIIGISTLFSGAALSAGIMAAIIEFSKVISVTFAYRYWNKTGTLLKSYIGIAIIILTIITSLGIFGYLSAAYQQSAIEYKLNQEKVSVIEGQKVYLNDKISQSKIRIQTLNDMRKLQEGRMNETLTNAFLTRNPIQLKQLQEQTVDLIKSADNDIKEEQNKIQATTDEIYKIDKQVNDMKFSSANKKDIRTFQFVADQFGTTLDTVAKWFIFIIICVFDPLAVALILAYNVAIYKKDEDENKIPLTIPEDGPSETIISSETINKSSESISSPELINGDKIEKSSIINTSMEQKDDSIISKARPNWL